MSIACLGWGSLIWDPRDLMIERTDPVEKAWSLDGPLLPVEFARHSSGNRLTLVLVPGRRTSQVLWANLLVQGLEVAKRNLAIRECRRPGHPIEEELVQRFISQWCGYWSLRCSKGNCAEVVGEWARIHELSAVIWTDFPPRFRKTDGVVPSSDEALEFLRSRSPQEQENAKTYITQTPKQVATPYRAEIERHLGWHPSGVI